MSAFLNGPCEDFKISDLYVCGESVEGGGNCKIRLDSRLADTQELSSSLALSKGLEILQVASLVQLSTKGSAGGYLINTEYTERARPQSPSKHHHLPDFSGALVSTKAWALDTTRAWALVSTRAWAWALCPRKERPQPTTKRRTVIKLAESGSSLVLLPANFLNGRAL